MVRGAERVELTHDLLTPVVREHRARQRESERLQRERQTRRRFGAVGAGLLALALVMGWLYVAREPAETAGGSGSGRAEGAEAAVRKRQRSAPRKRGRTAETQAAVKADDAQGRCGGASRREAVASQEHAEGKAAPRSVINWPAPRSTRPGRTAKPGSCLLFTPSPPPGSPMDWSCRMRSTHCVGRCRPRGSSCRFQAMPTRSRASRSAPTAGGSPARAMA